MAPQLIYKGGILNQWGKKTAVVVDRHFFSSLPDLPTTNLEKSDIAWLVYDLSFDPAQNRYDLTHCQTVYTAFSTVLDTITKSEAGSIEGFLEHLQQKLDKKLENGYPPDAPVLTDFIEE